MRPEDEFEMFDQPPNPVTLAFKRSLWVIGAVVMVWGGVWLISSDKPKAVAVDDAVVFAPKGNEPALIGDPPRVTFLDITADAGLDFQHVSGAYGERLMPEAMGPGAGFLDYDGDGDQDILLINARPWPGREQGALPTQALYANDGRGRFSNVTAEAGLDISLYGMGLAVGDFDNDGDPDIYITAVGQNRLLRNDSGRFIDVSEAAGVAGHEQDWSTASTFLDYDNDGDLDLWVGNYVRWSREIDLEIDFRLTGLGRAYGAPNHFHGVHSHLYRNEGDGRFVDVSAQAGMQVSDATTGAAEGKALGVVPVDYDRDGHIDLIVANDTTRNFVFHNLGDGRFEEVGAFEGVAYDRQGKATGAMGIDAAWYRNSDDLGIAIGNFANEMSSLMVTTEGRTPFADEAVLEGIGPDSRLALTFGVLFLDYDLDGRQDYLQANGHLEPDINTVQPSQHYAQPAQLFWNCGDACGPSFVRVKGVAALDQPMVARAAAYADIDGDGDLDLLLTGNGGQPRLLSNQQNLGHHWLRVRLIGKTANRDAIGALVELSHRGVTQRRQLTRTRSYLSAVEPELTFGLGKHDKIDALTIHWPGGQVQQLTVDTIDTTLVIEEPA